MESYVVYSICGTVLIIAILVLVFINHWAYKYFNYKRELDKARCVTEHIFYASMASKIENLIYVQNETLAKVKDDLDGY